MDRLGWAAGLSFLSQGLRVGIRVSDATILGRLPQVLPPGARPSKSPFVQSLFSVIVGGAGPRRGVRRFHVVYSGGSRIARTHDLEAALEILAAGVETYVSIRAPRRVFVHAGVVGVGSRAILIPGRSHSGKSWLVRALVQAGAEYYSDDFAVLDARGRVHPYPLPLMIRGSEGRSRWAIERSGGRIGRKPLPVGLVVVTKYSPRGRFRPRVVGGGRAVLELLSHTIAARHSPDRAFETLSRVVDRALVVKGARGEADEAARQILNPERWSQPEPVLSSRSLTVPEPLLQGG